MNLTEGQSSKKQHLQAGSAYTACHRKNSGINNNEFLEFKWWAEKHPEICCVKCVNKFNEKANRIANSNSPKPKT